jgi:hypothetical protein
VSLALPAGNYLVYTQAYQPSMDADVQLTLLMRRPGAGDQIIGSADVHDTVLLDGGLPGDYRVAIHAAAVPDACGAQLVLKLAMVAGSSPYGGMNIQVTTP